MTDQERLDQAKDAYHKLQIGAAFVEVRDSNGEMVRYKPADTVKLRSYIRELERNMGIGTVSRPIKVVG